MKILVACPRNHVTGGVELLHQLCHELNKYPWIESLIWYPYIPMDGDDLTPQPKEYSEYGNKWVMTKNPEEGATLIFPEIWANWTNYKEFEQYKKLIYWESVDNYLLNTHAEDALRFPSGIIHLAQSYYAEDFLKTVCKVPEENIIFVSDYLNESYLNADPNEERIKQVAYNPAKGNEFTQKLITTMFDVDFVPIKDMSKEEVRDLLCESAVYIDFGNHPGKDRIPREAAICGCCVITSKYGSAKYSQDVPIPECYKIDLDDEDALLNCERIIRDVLNHLDEHSAKFAPYREQIRADREMFEQGVEKLANRLNAPKFSVIIPAHNAEEHGLRAFQSIKSQTFSDFECIVVCDACSDKTEELAKSFGFRTVSTDFWNDGLARSKGIDLARGEWVMFMDDDDWWLHEYVLEMLADRLKGLECDVLCFSFIWKHVGYAEPLGNRGWPWPAVWNKVWRRDFIGDTRFPNIYSISDSFFHREMMGKNPRLAVWDMPFYYYNYLRIGSISEQTWKGEQNGNKGE